MFVSFKHVLPCVSISKPGQKVTSKPNRHFSFFLLFMGNGRNNNACMRSRRTSRHPMSLVMRRDTYGAWLFICERTDRAECHMFASMSFIDLFEVSTSSSSPPWAVSVVRSTGAWKLLGFTRFRCWRICNKHSGATSNNTIHFFQQLLSTLGPLVTPDTLHSTLPSYHSQVFLLTWWKTSIPSRRVAQRKKKI